MKYIIPLLMLIAFSACATTNGFNRLANSWLNHESNDLIASWGDPSRTTQGSEGDQILIYERAAQTGTASYTTPSITTTQLSYIGNSAQSFTTPGVTYTSPPSVYWCRVSFHVNGADIIDSWTAQGNGCLAQY